MSGVSVFRFDHHLEVRSELRKASDVTTERWGFYFLHVK